ncbi:MAG: EF2563 family selenium-dependent molybdenum hydroxylase system protein [Oscillospiraceae bacterium]|jgi:xanthine dehydrogenase accessory factor|nr:EF2563 family selenium-dependent molybdenum hydroxylase system protein [Oscillospiraceae bacterium]
MLVVIRGGGDLATGTALRLYRAGMEVVVCETAVPTSIRRTVCFSEAVRLGETEVEGVTARLAALPDLPDLLGRGIVPVLADPEGACIPALAPDAVVDAIIAKRNLGTRMDMAPVVVAAGPGFTAGLDCHAVVETMRGHYLGRVIYDGAALPNTDVPGLIGGYAGERVLRAPADGVFRGVKRIGDHVRAGEAAGYVDGAPMVCTIDGVLRGLLADGVPVRRGMKSGDVDPRCAPEHCLCASDKALAVGGGVLEAILLLSGVLRRQRP